MSNRPMGYDYSRPDPENWRCPNCNGSGMNRTGLRSVGLCGSGISTAWGVECHKCIDGLLPVVAQELGL